jgi:hypothetical protein
MELREMIDLIFAYKIDSIEVDRRKKAFQRRLREEMFMGDTTVKENEQDKINERSNRKS